MIPNVSSIDPSRALYDAHLRQHFGSVQGCSSSTIARLEGEFGCPLPAAYRDFLGWMGEHRNGPFRGSDCFPPHLASNNRRLPELLAENHIEFPLPTQFLVFFAHQGYIAAWFALPAQSDDPPVWMFNEGSTSQPEQRFTFSGWLLEYLQDTVRIAERLHQRP